MICRERGIIGDALGKQKLIRILAGACRSQIKVSSASYKNRFQF